MQPSLTEFHNFNDHACHREPSRLPHSQDHLGGGAPVPGLGGDGEGRDHAALAGAVTDVQLDAKEAGAGLAVAGVDAEGEDGDEHAHEQAAAQAAEALDGGDGQLAEDAEAVLLQQAVLEDLDGGRLGGCPIHQEAEVVDHGWPHLQRTSMSDHELASRSRKREQVASASE